MALMWIKCGRQNMLWPYLKIWDWELNFSHAVKTISSPGVRRKRWHGIYTVHGGDNHLLCICKTDLVICRKFWLMGFADLIWLDLNMLCHNGSNMSRFSQSLYVFFILKCLAITELICINSHNLLQSSSVGFLLPS